jgi:hypothetical protein
MKSTKFSVRLENDGAENEKLTVYSNKKVLLSAERSPAPVKGEPEELEKEFLRLAKSCDKVKLEKDDKIEHSSSELCASIFDECTKECAEKNIIYNEIKEKVYGLGIDQKEVSSPSDELDAILQNINDINKNLCWKIDPKYSFFKVERKYKIYLGNIKSRIDLVEKCISGEYAGATISY